MSNFAKGLLLVAVVTAVVVGFIVFGDQQPEQAAETVTSQQTAVTDDTDAQPQQQENKKTEQPVGDKGKADHIVISKQDLTLSLYDSDKKLICRFPVAVGKNYGNKQRSGDMKTPEGEFSVQMIQPASTWGHDFGDGKGWIPNCYGNWFIRLSTPPHKGIGIHGTHAPESIGTRATEGCIRLENKMLDSLKPMVKVGMKVTILSSDKDQAEDAKLRGDKPSEPQKQVAEQPKEQPKTDTKPESKPEAEVKSESKSSEQSTDQGELWHTIVEGDKFFNLAKQYGTTQKAIEELNPGVDPTKLQIGQKVRIK